jgi:hypothetical protein
MSRDFDLDDEIYFIQVFQPVRLLLPLNGTKKPIRQQFALDGIVCAVYIVRMSTAFTSNVEL